MCDRSAGAAAHQRWIEATRLVTGTSGVFRIRVREDGFIVQIEGETSSVQWDALEGGVVFLAPFALEAPQIPPTAPVDVSPVPVEEPAAGN